MSSLGRFSSGVGELERFKRPQPGFVAKPRDPALDAADELEQIRKEEAGAQYLKDLELQMAD